MRARICIGCGASTLNAGGRCSACGGGGRKRGRSPYANAQYRRMRDRVVGEHVRVHGPRCPRCGATVPVSDLTYNHTRTLSQGGDILGSGEVMCRSCNSRQLHVDRPDLARRRGGIKIRGSEDDRDDRTSAPVQVWCRPTRARGAA